MKLIKLGFISLIVLGIIVTLIGLLFPSTVLVSRAVDIKAPIDSIKYRVGNMNQWKHWIAGMNDSSVKIISSTNAQLGNTHVQISQITDSTVLSTWTSLNGQQQLSTIRIIGNSNQDYAVVQWQFVQKIGWYPWDRFGSMMNDKIMGTMMEQNLQSLKKTLEN
jgi:thiamine kinase-like enzyme